jgi:hypothetical protein
VQRVWIVLRDMHEHADAPYLLRLCARDERPRGRAAE